MTAPRIAALGWGLIATGFLSDPLEDTPGVGALGYPLAAGIVALVAMALVEASARGILHPPDRLSRGASRLFAASAVAGALISGAVAGAGLAGGFELGSVIVFAGGLATAMAADGTVVT